MIFHQSPYGQIIKFSAKVYYSISDEKLSEIEQNCANIDKEVITIGDSFTPEVDSDDIDLDAAID